jgi:hypothetical protein
MPISGLVPKPGEENETSPGRAFAIAISSFTLRAGKDGCVASTSVWIAACVIGAKSRSASYGTCLNVAGLIASVLMPITRV